MSDEIPLTPEARAERYQAQTDAQYRALGKFVQNFENAVEAVRRFVFFMLTSGHCGHVSEFAEGRWTGRQPRTPQENMHLIRRQQRIADIVLASMTAQPLLDAMRFIIVEITNFDNQEDVETRKEGETARDIAKQLHAELSEMIRLRNDILHGTWHIGWANPADQDFSKMNGYKIKPSKAGWDQAKLPETAEQLEEVAARCSELSQIAFRLMCCFYPVRLSVRKNFVKVDGRWLEPSKETANKL
jgi:hypothetical protein